jgi:hypothetical protein
MRVEVACVERVKLTSGVTAAPHLVLEYYAPRPFERNLWLGPERENPEKFEARRSQHSYKAFTGGRLCQPTLVVDPCLKKASNSWLISSFIVVQMP